MGDSLESVDKYVRSIFRYLERDENVSDFQEEPVESPQVGKGNLRTKKLPGTVHAFDIHY
jgi:hypothetical protein